MTDAWLWNRANFSLAEPMRDPMLHVRAFGEEHELPGLTVPKGPASETDGREMAAIAVETLGAPGVHRAREEKAFTFPALLTVKRVQ